MWLTDVSIRRPIFITMFVLALIVLGLTARSKMPAELYPNVEFPFISVVTVYPGAGPEEIETLISQPIEEAVGSVGNVKTVTSTSQDGVSVVGIEFNLGADIDAVAADVRDRLAAIRGELPKDIDTPIVYKADITALPTITIGLSGPLSAKEIRIFADDVVKDRLSRVPGVAAVSVSGGQVREIQVLVDNERLQAYGISINQVAAVLQGENLNLPSGSITAGQREFAVRTVGEFTSADQIRDLRIAVPDGKNGGSTLVRLADIAAVNDTVEEPTTYTRLNGKESVMLSVQKQSDANTVDVAKGVRKELERLRPVMPAGVKAIVVEDQSVFVEDALHDVNAALLEGIFLVVLIVFLFLHTVRATFIVALAIPTSIIATFLPMFSFGFTMNMMTMLALSLAVGILVDDSIVVLENIHRHLKLGESPRRAAYTGRSEIGLAAIAITLVDVVVFVPIAFMGGIVGQFFRQFGITVATATLFSLFVSFTLTPMLASRLLKPEREEAEGDGFPGRDGRGITERLFSRFDRFYASLDARYRSVLGWALENRFLTVVIGFVSLLVVFAFAMPQPKTPGFGWMPRLVIALIAAALAAVSYRKSKDKRVAVLFGVLMVFLALAIRLPFGFSFFPPVDRGNINVMVEAPAGTSLAQTDEIVRQIETVLERVPEMEFYESAVGSTAGASVFGAGQQGPQYARVAVKLVDKMQRKRTVYEVADAINRQTSLIPGATITVSAASRMGDVERPIQMEVTGRNMTEIRRVADVLAERTAQVPGVEDVDLSWKIGKPELQVEVDRLRAADLNLNVAQIASTLRTAIAGNTDSKFREAGREYDIRVRLRKFDRRSLSDVSAVIVGRRGGAPVYLRDVANVELRAGPTQIDRKNRQRLVTVSANVKSGYSTGNVQQMVSKVAAQVPVGATTINAGGEAEQMRESNRYLGQALMLSVILVYMLMAALFESLFSPFIIMFTLPQALVGGILALLITGKELSIVATIGVIMLMGLVAKNAILLVDYTNTLRSRGKSRDEAILEAGPTRLRPILMTTFAMIAGMMPTAVAVTRGAEMRSPMAITVIGGLILSTMLTLIVIPVMYTLMDDFVNRWKKRLPWFRGEEETRLPRPDGEIAPDTVGETR